MNKTTELKIFIIKNEQNYRIKGIRKKIQSKLYENEQNVLELKIHS